MTKAMRAWNGGLKNIDELLSWMYDEEILNKTERAKKDSLFRQYYRYYNDGDFPRSLNKKGLHTYSRESYVREALEKLIEDFIKKILTKYSGKYERRQFRRSKRLKELHTLKRIIDGNDFHAIITYWSKEIKVKNVVFNTLLEKSTEMYNKLNKIVNDKIDSHDWNHIRSWDRPKGMNLNYRIQMLKGHKLYTATIDKQYNELIEVFKTMSSILSEEIEKVYLMVK